MKFKYSRKELVNMVPDCMYHDDRKSFIRDLLDIENKKNNPVKQNIMKGMGNTLNLNVHFLPEKMELEKVTIKDLGKTMTHNFMIKRKINEIIDYLKSRE